MENLLLIFTLCFSTIDFSMAESLTIKSPKIKEKITQNFFSLAEESLWPILNKRSEFLHTLKEVNVSNECRSAFHSLIHGLDHHEMWALQSE